MKSIRRFSGLGFLVLTLSAACLSVGLASAQDSKGESMVQFETQAATAIDLPAQTFTTLHSFDGTDGDGPKAALIQAADGNLYGTTFWGGATSGYGTVFTITPSGTLTTLYSFSQFDGMEPTAALVQATDGNFYGTTSGGGADFGSGTLFKITPSGTLTTLYSFYCEIAGCPDGTTPSAGLVQGTDGNFYGTTSGWPPQFYGTVFKATPSGTLTTLYGFGATDGVSALVQAADGNFYGTTSGGGANNDGTVFKITPSGTLTTLHSFDGTDGSGPTGLIQASDGNFYGTALSGGANGYGTIFKITPGGTLTTPHSFDFTDGSGPSALVQSTDGNFYGTTGVGGANSCVFEGVDLGGCGTIFKITPSGTLTTLHNFDGTDGYGPNSLVQDTNGTFYGTTFQGGIGGGTVFSLSVGLGPFVETQPTSGKVGAYVKILGTNLTSATKVTFNGTPAVFKVVSSSLITTTVPFGATTGKIQVVTPSGTLSSNVPFRVPRARLSVLSQSQSKQGTTLTLTLMVTNAVTAGAQNILIDDAPVTTLAGTGTVTLMSPSLPLSVGNLAIGANTPVTLTLDVPATVTKFSVSESGTLQDPFGDVYNFALGQVVFP
jgi:uncharacterized repeat protein (TIGR03803 family)